MTTTDGYSDSSLGLLNFLIQVSRLFGLAPVSIASDGIRISRYLVLYSRIMIIVMNICIIVGLVVDVCAGPELAIRLVSPVKGGLWVANVCIVMVLANDGVYNAPWRIFSLIQMLKAMNKVQFETGAPYNQYLAQRKIRIVIVSVIFTTIVLIIADFRELYCDATHKKKEVKALYLYISFFAEYCIAIILEIQFVVLMHMPYLGLHFVNCGLQELLTEYSGRVEAALSCRNCVKIRKLSKHYVNICKIIREINKSNGSTLLCIMGMLLVDFVTNTHYWITCKELYRDFLAVESFWGVFHVVTTTFVLKPIHKTQLEIQETHDHLRSIIHRVPMDMAVKLELERFVHHLILNDASYSPMGIYTMSTSLFIATTSGMASYIVLIV